MKLYTKIGAGIAAGAALAIAIPTQAQTLETQLATQEVKPTENPNPTNNSPLLKESYTYEEYKQEIGKRLADSEFDYKDAKELIAIAKKVTFNQPKTNSGSNQSRLIESIEEKAKKYFLESSGGTTSEIKISNEELMIYMMALHNRLNLNGGAPQLEQKVSYTVEPQQLSHNIQVYQNYVNECEKWMNLPFVKTNKYWSPGIIGGDEAAKNFKEMIKPIREEFSLLGYRGLTIKGLGEQFPIQTKYGLSSDLMVTFGILFPIIRNLAVTRILRKKSKGLDYLVGGAVNGCLINGIFFGSLLDSLHPLVYPIRVFGTPFILQPLRKLIFGDKILEDLGD